MPAVVPDRSHPTADSTDADADKASRALSLFETLRATLDADQQCPPPRPSQSASTLVGSHRGDQASSKVAPAASSCLHAAPAAAAGKGPSTEDPEKALLRRQVAHAEAAVKSLHDTNSKLRARVRELEAAAATTGRETEATAQQQQHRIAELTVRVGELSVAAAAVSERASTQSEAPPTTCTALRLTALESELAALRHRLQLCEGQRDRLAVVQLAPLLARDPAVDTQVARLVNAQVRELFGALKQQLTEEAVVREAERVRWSELRFLLERDLGARAEL